MLSLRKISGSYEDFRNSLYDVELEAFISYNSIIATLFGPTAPIQFYSNILKLYKVYKWLEALPISRGSHPHHL